MKYKMCVLILFVLICNYSILAQTILTIVDVDENTCDLEISTASRITFFADSITILPRIERDIVMTYSISDVQKMLFGGVLNDNNAYEDRHITLYPNPGNKFFIIEDLEAGEHQLSIYSMGGIEILRKRYRPGRLVDVSSLKSGCYIVRVGNTCCKFIKK